jgi:threonine/homoserine/homoserine lactone efflux protein
MGLFETADAVARTTLLELLAGFFAGYAAVLVTPGPNLLAIGGISALYGLRGAAPLCAGASFGAGCLATVAFFAAGMASTMPKLEEVSRFAGGLLLGYVAIAIACRAVPQQTSSTCSGSLPISRFAAFGAGFFTAATNPLTASFFAAQFLGPLNPHQHGRDVALAIPCVVLAAFGFFLCVALLFARPVVRQSALAWHRTIRISAAALLALMALNTTLPFLTKSHLVATTAGPRQTRSTISHDISVGTPRFGLN